MLSEDRIKELIKDYYKNIYAFCLTQLEDADDAHDAVQSVFTLMIERADKLEDNHMKAWLFEVAARSVRNILRQRKRRAKFISFEESYDDIILLEDSSFDFERDSVSEKEILAEKEIILAELSDKERELYQLIYNDKLKQKEISQVLGISLKAVSVRSYRLREKIKKLAQAAFSALLMLIFNFGC